MHRWRLQHHSMAHERFPIGRPTRGMKKFNISIDNYDVLEILVSNGMFTWSRGGVSSHSLIGKLISKEWDDIFDNTKVARQAQIFSDHFPLLLEAGVILWGPSPFRLFNSWLPEADCCKKIGLCTISS